MGRNLFSCLAICLIAIKVNSFEHGSGELVQSQTVHLNRYVRHARGDPQGGGGGGGEDKHKKGKFNMSMCCNVEPSDSQNEQSNKMRELEKECAKEVFDGDSKKKPGAFHCISECVGKKMNFIDEANNFKEDEFRTAVNEIATYDYQKAIADETATKCIEKVKSAAANDPAPTPEEAQCSKTASKAYFCVAQEFLKSCPAESQDGSDRCVKFRMAMEDGQFHKHFGHGPPPPPPPGAAGFAPTNFGGMHSIPGAPFHF